MQVISPRIRKVIYIITAIATPVVTYLGTQGRIEAFYLGLYSVIVTAVTALASANVTDNSTDK